MLWLSATLIEPIWQDAAATTPTNPSSLTLAMIGVGTLLLFRLKRRSKLQGRVIGNEISRPATAAKKRRAA